MGRTVDTFLSGANATFVFELYERYLRNPAEVDPSWVHFFQELGDDGQSVLNELRGATWARSVTSVIGGGPTPEAVPVVVDRRLAFPSAEEVRKRTLDSIRALMLIRVYRVRGHLLANLDPLGLEGEKYHPELDYHTYGFEDADLDREIFIDNVLGLETPTLRQIIEVVRETYCGNIGVEFMHIQDAEQKAWIQRRIETIRNQTAFTPLGRRTILERLTEAEGFERFLQMKYVGTKRFGLEGAESLVPLLEQILKRGSQLGVSSVILGMAHRGRLNVLANILHKPYQAIFSEFQGNPANPEDVQGSGDVKYHLGTSADREFDGVSVHLSLIANPSHLEAADPVVLGKVRASQTLLGRDGRDAVLGIILHGDAAFAGQGMVSECLGLSQLKGYQTGGTIHVIINNQIGFTTAPHKSRSSPYCSDVAKGVQAPIFHVNGDDPESVVHVARIATEYRHFFESDVVIDMVCYRRQGHNEADEPGFTQPIMYRKIAAHPTTRALYATRLVSEGLMTEGETDGLVSAFQARMAAELEAAMSYRPNKADWLEGKWKGLAQATGEEELRLYRTEVSDDLLREVGRALSTPPAGFNVNSKIQRQLEAKARMIETGEGIDWATGEALAFGTLLAEGTAVRLSGQDSCRGTFSQRHAVLVDQENEATHTPLAHISPTQATFEVIDSPLSEESVLGFEYGYTLADPSALVMWEAQFGDFANGAQVIFDQFISSSESKWLRMSGLVVMLPHGYEGQGPEHSSGRLERYLQLCAEDNMQVLNCSTPANFFHALRRQVRRNFRKPMIVMTPKSLLRHKLCVSTLAEFGPGSRFHRVLPETWDVAPDEDIRRVVLCSGKVYYDLWQTRADRGLRDVVLVRVEQFYPWPKQSLINEITRYPKADLVWCQEEPANMGAFMFVDRRLQYILDELDRAQRWPIYAGRAASASTASGLLKRHHAEQALLVEQALTGAADEIVQPFRRPTQLSLLSAH
ncbi:MAG: 2-oxoglutarate dehydrogenase E1 component [Alphaproteobacteria bacterium]|nr:2-oxoglutarate dehydrogenase E1 component [Alphaproteobacteria bacterium]